MTHTTLDIAAHVRIPEDIGELRLRAEIVASNALRRARTRAMDADDAFRHELEALFALQNVGLLDGEQVGRWVDETGALFCEALRVRYPGANSQESA